MKTKNFNHDLNKLIAGGASVVPHSELFDKYLYQGHPHIHIDSFDIDDAFIVLTDYISNHHNEADIDANGGSFEDPLSAGQDGKINITYIFEDISFNDNDPIDIFHINMEGYVLEKKKHVYFLVTKLSYDNKLIKK